MILIASDHAGFNAKEKLKSFLKTENIDFLDLGTNSVDRCDYPDFAGKLSVKIHDKSYERGILICGSGIHYRKSFQGGTSSTLSIS